MFFFSRGAILKRMSGVQNITSVLDMFFDIPLNTTRASVFRSGAKLAPSACSRFRGTSSLLRRTTSPNNSAPGGEADASAFCGGAVLSRPNLAPFPADVFLGSQLVFYVVFPFRPCARQMTLRQESMPGCLRHSFEPSKRGK